MAKKQNQTAADVRVAIDDIRKNKFAPVYILHGDEPYYIDLVIKNLEKYVVAEDDRDFNLSTFYGNDADVDYVIGAAQQFPVMADRKLVLLKEAQGMVKAREQLERFASYVTRPSAATVFVIAYKGEPLAATSKLLKAAKKSGAVVITSVSPKDYEVAACFNDYCTQHKISIEDKARLMLVEYIGTPLSKLFGELDKLVSIKGPGQRITAQDVEDNIGVSKDYNNFELINAITHKDYPKAIRIVNYFESNPKSNSTPQTTGALFGHFARLVTAHYLQDKSDQSLAAEFNLRSSFMLNDFKLAMRNFPPRASVNAIRYIREFDTKSKGIDSMLNEYDLLRELIFKIFT